MVYFYATLVIQYPGGGYFWCYSENSALSEHTCLTNHTIGWDNSKIITTNRRYHQRLCLEAWHINSAHAPLLQVCFLTPIYTSSEKRPLISDNIKGPLVAAFGSPLMKALDRSVETLGLWIVTSSVTFIKYANQSSIKLCLNELVFFAPKKWKHFEDPLIFKWIWLKKWMIFNQHLNSF